MIVCLILINLVFSNRREPKHTKMANPEDGNIATIQARGIVNDKHLSFRLLQPLIKMINYTFIEI